MIKVVIFKDVLLLVTKTPLSFSDEECSYLAQLLLRSRSSVLKISCMASNAKASYAVWMEGAHIWHTDCLWCVDFKKKFQISDMTLESKVKIKHI